MSNYKTIQFKVLNDSCSSEDRLEDQTHKRIADKLFEIITARNEDGMTIGLEGEWGSGKSTVVKLLQERLKTEKVGKSFVFYIDAWEHEGDHLRRVFLETLIEKVKKWKEWPKEIIEQLNDIADRVTAKKVAKTIEHTSQITGFGKVVAFATLFVPLGASLLSTFAERVTFKWTGYICWEFWLSFLVTIAPAWVYIIRWGLNKFSGRKVKYALFSTEANVDTTYETSREEERSSVEFERYFAEILQIVAMDIDSMIMVIDNLDRVNPEDALRIWSTLQAFVQNKNPVTKNDKRLCKWIIVPYAQEGLSKIWDTVQVDNVKDVQGVNRPVSFMQKSFQLRLHVPKMVISGWKSFAEKCLMDAAGNLDEEDAQIILNVLSWTRESLTDAPSPRQVKIYINQVGMACALHGERVPLEAICFYVIKKYLQGLTDAQLEDKLRKGEIAQASLPQYKGNNALASEVAAMLYGVEENKAMQILLEPTITFALKVSDSGYLNHVRSIHQDVFYDVLSYIFHYCDTEMVPKYAGSIQKAFDGSDGRACNIALSKLRLFKDVAVDQMPDTKHEDAIAIIALAGPDVELAGQIASAYASELPKRFRSDGGATPSLENKPEYINSPEQLIKCFADVENAAKKVVKIPYGSFKSASVDFSRFSKTELKQLARYMNDLNGVDIDITKAITPTDDVPEWATTLFAIKISRGLYECETILEAITSAFSNCDDDTKLGLLECSYWGMLLNIEAIPQGNRPVNILRDFLTTDAAWQSEEFPHEYAAFFIAKYCGDQDDESLLPSNTNARKLQRLESVWSSENVKVGKTIYEAASISHEFEWLTREAVKPERALVGSIAEAALDANESSLFKVERPFKFLANLLTLVGEEHKDMLLNNFVSDESRLRGLIASDGEDLANNPNACEMVLDKIKGHALYFSLAQKVKSGLNNLTSDKWTEMLSSSGASIRLLKHLEQNGIRPELANTFANAYRDMVTDAIRDDVDISMKTEELVVLYDAMKSAVQGIFISSIAKTLKDTDFCIHTLAIRDFVLNVPDYDSWLANSSFDVKGISASLPEKGNIEAFENFVEILTRCGANITYKGELRELLEQPLQTMAKSNDADSKRVAEKAAAWLGIKIIEPNAPEIDGVNHE